MTNIIISAEKFKFCVGVGPTDDDLERCNCKQAGKPGHFCCGWDNIRDMPVFIPGESAEINKTIKVKS
jgi:hypothetical protein